MHEIHPGLLWIGNALDAREPRLLFDAGVAAVIDVAAEESPAQLPRQLIYCRFPLNDGGGNDARLLLQTLRTTIGCLQAELPTLIACSAGMSRSPAVAAVALAQHLSAEPEDVLARIATVRSLEIKSELWSDLIDGLAEL